MGLIVLRLSPESLIFYCNYFVKFLLIWGKTGYNLKEMKMEQLYAKVLLNVSIPPGQLVTLETLEMAI